MPQSPESKRLTIVFQDLDVSTLAFAKILEISQMSAIRMMKGTQPITFDVTRVICYKLGYSTEWFLLGTGRKKANKEDVKLVTEISLLRVDYEIVFNKNRSMEARMHAYESELEELKNMIKKQ